MGAAFFGALTEASATAFIACSQSESTHDISGQFEIGDYPVVMQPPVSACSEEPADLRSHGLQADAQACQIEEILFKKENTLYVPIISYGGEKLTTGRFHTLR